MHMSQIQAHEDEDQNKSLIFHKVYHSHHIETGRLKYQR